MARAKKEPAAEAPQTEQAESAPAPAAQESKTAFVRMRMGDDSIDVHPLCVEDHERLGWSRA